MCQTNKQLEDIQDAMATGDAVTEANMIDQHSEEFDLYEWALEFSRAAGFEFERVSPITGE